MRQLEKSSEQGFGASPVGDVGQSSALARTSGRRGRPEAGWISKQALRSERWAGVRKQAPFLLGQTFWSVIGSPFWPVCSDT